MILNINQLVTVTLTSTGREALRQENDKFPTIRHLLSDDKRQWALWDLMHTFGPYMYVGMPEPLFEGNNIVVED